MLIVGCGNADRCDDAAGVLVARRLRELGIDAQEHGGEGLSLLEEFAGHQRVILIDAVLSGRQPGTIVKTNPGDGPLPTGQFLASSHSFGVAEAVEMARALGRLPGGITIYGIEAGRLEAGSAPSAEVLAAVDEVARTIAREVGSYARVVVDDRAAGRH